MTTAKTMPPKVDPVSVNWAASKTLPLLKKMMTRVTVMTMIEITSSVADTRAETRTLVMVRKIAPASSSRSRMICPMMPSNAVTPK